MRNNFVLQLIYIFICSLICRTDWHLFHDAAYSLPSVLKSNDLNEKMHIVANVSFGSSVNDDVSNMSYDDHIEKAAIKFNLPHGRWLLHD